MRWLALGASTAVLALATVVVGCGEDDRAPPGVPADSGAGRRDGGGHVDASGTDGGDRPDGTLPGADGGVDPGTCVHDPGSDVYELGVDSMGRPRHVSIAPGAEGFLAVWAATEDGAENVYARWIPSGAGPVPRQKVTDDFFLSSAPAVARLGDEYLVVWEDNRDGADLMARRVGASGAPVGGEVRLTNDARVDAAPALVARGTGAWLGWVRVEDEGGRSALVVPLGGDGTPAGSPTDISPDDTFPGQLALATRAGGAVAVWSDWVSGGGEPQAWLRRLDASGAPVADAVRVDAEGNAAGPVDVALGEDYGAIAFGVRVGGARPEVRFRMLAPDGTLAGSERTLDTGGDLAADPSVALFAGGLAMAYRVVGEGEPSVRLAFVDRSGALTGELPLGLASSAGGRTSVAVSGDGNILVAWSDVESGETRIRARRVRCGRGGGGMDAGVPDAGVEAGTDGGTDIPDAAPVDAPDATEECRYPDGSIDPCACPVPSCSPGDCPANTRCIADGCGSTRCVPAGHECVTAGDCSSGSDCLAYPAGRTCVPSGPADCNDSRDCPLGFACESGSCVDRRIWCDPTSDVECPIGFHCLEDLARGEAFCNRYYKPCATDGACFGGGLCRDVDGDGPTQCTFRGTCETNADCTVPGEVCGSVPRVAAACDEHGPCASDADCASGYDCLDLWGDGLGECVPSGGSCSSSADCPPGQVCASRVEGSAPECIGSL